MKWYKKQMDQLKKLQAESAKTTKTAPAKTAAKNTFDPNKMRLKKIQKPGEKRSRAKTDSI